MPPSRNRIYSLQIIAHRIGWRDEPACRLLFTALKADSRMPMAGDTPEGRLWCR